MQLLRRRLVLAGLAAACGGATALAQPMPRTVRIVARKFEFVPAEIALAKGEPVVFELTSEDVTMGFYLPAYNAGTEIIPGRLTRFPFTPDRAGTFEFICDVFCGEGHEDMAGKIVVSA